MAVNQNKKMTKYRRPVNLNIGIIIFAVIFIYILICVFIYFTQKHIAGYEVTMGSLSYNNIYKSIVLRDETVMEANQAGYINYLVREGTRVGVGNPVYAIDQLGELSDYLSKSDPEENTLSAADLTELKTEISGFVHNFSTFNVDSVYDFKYNVQGTIMKLANHNIKESIAAINGSGSELIYYGNSPITGVVIYSVDGMESLTLEEMTKDIFDIKNYNKEQLISNELVGVGEAVYKLSTNEDWAVVINVDPEKAADLEAAEYVKVRFLKNQYLSWGKVSSFTNESGDTFVKLTFTNSMITFCTDRFLDIELITEEESGLKIPNSSIVEKEFYIVPKEYITKGGKRNENGVLRETYLEDGTLTTEFIETTIYNETDTEYYLDDTMLRIGDYLIKPESTAKYALSRRGSLIGVYNINKGYADFKQIKILYQNEEYAIVRSNTQYGLSVYDYIVLDAVTVNEDDLIYE